MPRRVKPHLLRFYLTGLASLALLAGAGAVGAIYLCGWWFGVGMDGQFASWQGVVLIPVVAGGGLAGAMAGPYLVERVFLRLGFIAPHEVEGVSVTHKFPELWMEDAPQGDSPLPYILFVIAIPAVVALVVMFW